MEEGGVLGELPGGGRGLGTGKVFQEGRKVGEPGAIPGGRPDIVMSPLSAALPA